MASISISSSSVTSSSITLTVYWNAGSSGSYTIIAVAGGGFAEKTVSGSSGTTTLTISSGLSSETTYTVMLGLYDSSGTTNLAYTEKSVTTSSGSSSGGDSGDGGDSTTTSLTVGFWSTGATTNTITMYSTWSPTYSGTVYVEWWNMTSNTGQPDYRGSYNAGLGSASYTYTGLSSGTSYYLAVAYYSDSSYSTLVGYDENTISTTSTVTFNWTYAGINTSTGEYVYGTTKVANLGVLITAQEWNDMVAAAKTNTGKSISSAAYVGNNLTAAMYNAVASVLGVTQVSAGNPISASCLNALRTAINNLA